MSKVISDYNGYDYKKIFWEDADRRYEDLADRLAVRRLLPKNPQKLIDVAGGYGRLAPEYLKIANHSVLFDYSKTELEQAKELYGNKLETRAGDIYHIPAQDSEFDCLIMVRATHHFKDMDKVLAETYRILAPGGTAIIEVANKRTLPKMARYLLKKSDINPFSRQPSNLKSLNKSGFFNYHPKYIEDLIRSTGYKIDRVLSVSNFRSSALKKALGPKVLIKLESPAQRLLSPLRFAPSIYYRLKKPKLES